MDAARPIVLIEADEKGTYHVNPEALEVLSAIKKPLSVVSVVGKYRTGKSFLLNRILLDRKSGFGVGPTIRACTKGIWMWSDPLSVETADGEECALILLDTEGLGALDEDANHDTRIFLLALLLASNFIYNSVGSLDEAALSNLSLIVNLTKQLQVRSAGQQDADEMSQYFPSLLWVLRDFALQLVDRSGSEISPKDYLENALMPQKGVSDNVEQKNRIRRYIKHFFKERDCFPLIRPSEQEEVLQALDTASDDVLRPDFVTQMVALRKFVMRKAKLKLLNGKKVTGDMLGSLATAYVQAINTGSVPNIDNAWNYMCKSECERLTQASVSELEATLTGFSFPEQAAALKEKYQVRREELVQRFRLQAVGPQVNNYEAELKNKLRQIYMQVKETNEKAIAAACDKNFSVFYKDSIEKLKAGEYTQLLTFKRDLDNYIGDFRKGELKGVAAEKKLSEFSEKILTEAAEHIQRGVNQEAQNQQRRMAQMLELAQSQLAQKKEEYAQEAEDLKARLEKAEKDGHTVKAQVLTATLQLEEYQRDKQRLEERYKERIEELKNDHAERNTELKQRVEDTTKQLGEIHAKHAKEMAALEKDKALLEQELKFKKEECEDLKAKRAQMDAEAKALRTEIRELRETKGDPAEAQQLKAEIEQLKGQLDKATKSAPVPIPSDLEVQRETARLRAELEAVKAQLREAEWQLHQTLRSDQSRETAAEAQQRRADSRDRGYSETREDQYFDRRDNRYVERPPSERAGPRPTEMMSESSTTASQYDRSSSRPEFRSPEQRGERTFPEQMPERPENRYPVRSEDRQFEQRVEPIVQNKGYSQRREDRQGDRYLERPGDRSPQNMRLTPEQEEYRPDRILGDSAMQSRYEHPKGDYQSTDIRRERPFPRPEEPLSDRPIDLYIERSENPQIRDDQLPERRDNRYPERQVYRPERDNRLPPERGEFRLDEERVAAKQDYKSAPEERLPQGSEDRSDYGYPEEDRISGPDEERLPSGKSGNLLPLRREEPLPDKRYERREIAPQAAPEDSEEVWQPEGSSERVGEGSRDKFAKRSDYQNADRRLQRPPLDRRENRAADRQDEKVSEEDGEYLSERQFTNTRVQSSNRPAGYRELRGSENQGSWASEPVPANLTERAEDRYMPRSDHESSDSRGSRPPEGRTAAPSVQYRSQQPDSRYNPSPQSRGNHPPSRVSDSPVDFRDDRSPAKGESRQPARQDEQPIRRGERPTESRLYPPSDRQSDRFSDARSDDLRSEPSEVRRDFAEYESKESSRRGIEAQREEKKSESRSLVSDPPSRRSPGPGIGRSGLQTPSESIVYLQDAHTIQQLEAELLSLKSELTKMRKQLKESIDQKNAALRRMEAEQIQAKAKAESGPALASMSNNKELLSKTVGLVCRYCSQVIVVQFFLAHSEECQRDYENRLRLNPDLTLVSVPQASLDGRGGEKFVVSCKRGERVWMVYRTFEAVRKLQTALEAVSPDFEFPSFAEVLRSSSDSIYSKARTMPLMEKQKELERYLVALANSALGREAELRKFLG